MGRRGGGGRGETQSLRKTYITYCLERCYEYDTETRTPSSHRVCTYSQGAQAEYGVANEAEYGVADEAESCDQKDAVSVMVAPEHQQIGRAALRVRVCFSIPT